MKGFVQKFTSRMLRAFVVAVLGAGLAFASGAAQAKEKVHALYIPLADHYAGIVAGQVLGTAAELAKQAETLRAEVDKFLVDVRAA